MGFKVATSATFWTDVELEMLAEDGRELRGKIKVQFKRMDREQFEEFLRMSNDVPLDTDGLLQIMTGWKGAEDEGGEMPFTRENVKRFCDQIPGSYLRIAKRFMNLHAGVAGLKEAREGN